MQFVHEKTGSLRSTLSNLYHDRMERVDYETLRKLCELLNVMYGQLVLLKQQRKSSIPFANICARTVF